MRTARFAFLSSIVAAAGSMTACAPAPLSNFRPAAGLLPDRSLEIGGGGTAVQPRRYVDEPLRGGAQAWVSGKPGKHVTTTGIAAYEAAAVALGGALRLDAVKTDRFALGPELELGYLWAALNIAASVRIVQHAYLYTAPRVGTRGTTWALDIPVGLSLPLSEGLHIRPEYRFTWTSDISYYQKRDMIGIAMAYQF